MLETDGNFLDRMNLLRSWSRHHNHRTPKGMKDVWRTSYQNNFNGRKINFHPDRFIVDYYTGKQIAVGGAYGYNSSLRTSFNERARDGFKYWVTERPRPSHCKYKKNWKIWNRYI